MEPVVFLTNWLIAVQCIYLFKKLHSLHSDQPTVFHWKFFFLLFGGSTFFGGLSHLLFHYTGLAGKIPGWSLAILSITFLERAVFDTNREKNRFWIRLVWWQTGVIFLLLILDFRFIWVTVQTVVGLVLVLGIYSFIQIRKGRQNWKGFLFGIGWMILSVPVVVLKIDPSPWFNRHDISHLLMMLCLHQFYLTILKISKEEDQKKGLHDAGLS